MTTEDEKVIQRIRAGERSVYPEQRFVLCWFMPGLIVAFISITLLLLSIVYPDSEIFPFEAAQLGTIVGICILIPGVILWSYYRTTYSFVGLGRIQLSLSITSLELTNHGYDNVQRIISPKFPNEYKLLPIFTSIGPGILLERLQGIDWDPATLARMDRQKRRYAASAMAAVGGLAITGGLLMLPVFSVISLLNGPLLPIIFLLELFLLTVGFSLLLRARRRLHALEKEALDTAESAAFSRVPSEMSSKCSVEDVIFLIRVEYTHPIRVLLLETYEGVEYTELTYRTGDRIELRVGIINSQ
ncbi:MAG: hypothetical protein ACFFCP_05000 [Promethearchaeota archaeon]